MITREVYDDTYYVKNQRSYGFTVVELLIVVVVIAILAAIVFVTYGGITSNAREAALRSDLKSASTALTADNMKKGGNYPTNRPTYISTGLSYVGGVSFCISGAVDGKKLYIDELDDIKEGDCPLPVATTMQTFTSAHCAALAVYTGINPSAVRTLTDSRGGATRSYRVAKLADGKCWMLTNLRLGSTVGSITLTPGDSNVSGSFTLPRLVTTGSPSYDTAIAYGPAPGDTGSGATNYGYLYNFPAASAGESRVSKPGGSGNATYSVCPANWRLPAGGAASESEYALLGGRFGDSVAANNFWRGADLFGGVMAGEWLQGGFTSTGSNGYLWTATVGSDDNAFSAPLSSSTFNYSHNSIYARSAGLGVRCVLA